MRKTPESSATIEAKQSDARLASTRGTSRARNMQRRRGQTLLIAVLLMIFAALLGATFITVVALNLNQTTRGTNRAEAQTAALAGLRYANDQITNSTEGEKWNPLDDRIPEVDPDDPDYYDATKFDAYYSAFEQAQGWTGYVKYPNPLALTSALRNSPTFLAKVDRIKLLTEANPDPESGERGGQLRLDIIGRSADNDAVFSRRIAYKPTSENGGPGAYARFDSNFDFGRNRVIQTKAQLTAPTASATDQTITVEDASGFTRGRLAMVATTTGTLAATIAGVSTGTNQLQLRFATPVIINDDAVVRAASPLSGNIQSGKFDATGNAAATALLVNSGTTFDTEQDGLGGVFINGGLSLINRIALKLHIDTTNPQGADQVQVAGVIARNDTDATAKDYTPNTITKVQVVNQMNATTDAYNFPANGATTAQVHDNTASEQGDPTADVVRPLTPGRIDGANSRYLKLTRGSGDAGAEFGYGRGVYIDNAEDVEKVGRRINGTTLDFRSLTVAETQRLWQRKSFPVPPNLPANIAENGNVNNGDGPGDANGAYTKDIAAVPNNPYYRLAWRDLTKTPAVVGAQPYDYPLAVPAPTPSPPAPAATPAIPFSLEERGIRGWVSPWEYKPRGVLIELQGNNIIITRDDRSDVNDSSDARTSAPDAAKAWKDANGNLVDKSYRMLLNTTTGQRYILAPGETPASGNAFGAAVPFNGVIYAEGNLRVRGFLNTNAPDVTIVSMNNIYVEGNIRRLTVAVSDDGHVALLAKNNVVLNPTLFAAPLEGSADRDVAAANITASPAAVGATTLTVSSIAPLRIGDLIRVGKNLPLVSVTGITAAAAPPGSGTLTVSPPLVTAVDTTANIVRVLADPEVQTVSGYVGTNPVAPSYAYGVNGGSADNSPNGAFLRDVPLDGAPVPTAAIYAGAMRHIGQRLPAFTLTAGADNNPNAQVQIKAETNSLPNIQSGEKKMLLTSPSVGSPTIYDLLQIGSNPATADTNNRGKDDVQVLTELASKVNADNPVGPPPLLYWTMTASSGGTRARQLPIVNQLLNPGEAIDVPLTVSTRLFWIPNAAAPADLSLTAFGFGSSFDQNVAPSAVPPVPYPPTDTARTIEEDTALIPGSLNWNFYQTALTTLPVAPQQAAMRWYSRTFAQPNSVGSNVFGLVADSGAGLPNHQLGAFKMERNGGNGDFDLGDTNDDGNGDFQTAGSFAPGLDIRVDAQIYAQNGSWFVIPMPTLEPAAQLTDTPDKLAASTRFRRLNYRIAVRGSISQNFAPPLTDYDNEVDPDGVATGPQQRWIDSLAYPTQVTSGSGGNYGTNWTTIRYIGEKPPFPNNLKMPVSPDLLYVN